MTKQLGVVLACTLWVSTAISQDSISRKLDELLDHYQKQRQFNGSVLVAQKGKLLTNKGWGFQNAALSIKNSPSSIFRIYSITKTFTSSVILKLIEENKLALSDRLSKFYPGYPHGDSITIEQLLSHTAGIYDYTAGNTMPDQTEKSFVEFEKSKPLDFPPGTNWSYSNSGYYFLGYIIQKITGLSYEKAVAKYILDPLQMKATGFDFKYLVNRNKAIGYSKFTQKVKTPSVIYDPPGPFAAGALHSTIGDLYKYYEGLHKHTFLRKESLEKAYTPVRNNYGLGWISVSQFGKNAIGHSGGGAGFSSNFVQIPEDDICIVVLSNIETDLNSLTGAILKVLYNQPYSIPKTIQLKKEVLETYSGTYFINDNLVIYVSIEDNHLVAQPKGQAKNILFPEAVNKFYVEELSDYVHFSKNKRNQIDTLAFRMNGEDLKAYKIYPAWGIIGSATANGWEGEDIKLIPDNKKGVWSIKNLRLKKGELKFRFNNDWTINLGEISKGNLGQDAGNIKVEEGVYDIILDLRDREKLKFTINKR